MTTIPPRLRHRRPRRRRAARRAGLAPALLVTALLAGCGAGGSGSGSGGRPVVVATTTQLGDMVREVGGDAIDVHQMLQPNTDPHEYEPRPADARAVAGAKLVVMSGDKLDAWAPKLVQEAGADPVELTIAPGHTPQRIAASEEAHAEGEAEEHGGVDPHWWHDPRNAVAAVAAIRAALVRTVPGARAAIDRNAAAYTRKLEALDARIARCMAAVPAAERKLVTSHDAFGYFAARYNITVVGAAIPSQSTRAQPSAGDTSRLVALVKREKVKAIFPESSINPRLAQAIARATGASARATLYGDTLGPAGSSGDTYLKMEQANADAMVSGFEGSRRTCGTATS